MVTLCLGLLAPAIVACRTNAGEGRPGKADHVQWHIWTFGGQVVEWHIPSLEM